MNFLHDFSQKLDTRGRNWSCLYRHHDRDRLRFARSLELIFQDPKGGNAHPGYTIDDLWLHIGGISFEDSFQKRCQFIQNLARTMDQGTPGRKSWQKLFPGGIPMARGPVRHPDPLLGFHDSSIRLRTP